MAAFGHGDEEPVVVLEHGRVVAASASARAGGAAVGQRRREAEHHSPGVLVLARDHCLEVRAFEPVAAAIATLAPLVEVVRPGMLALDARGPARYFGGETRLRARIVEVARPTLPPAHRLLRVGIADGRFAADLAARRDMIVPAGQAARFLAPLPVAVLGDADLAELLVRLGLASLGDFAGLPEHAVRARFGPLGEAAHRRARGLDDEALRGKPPATELVARTELDPPAERADVAAFAGRALADELIELLGAEGLACVRLVIEAETEHGEQLSRRWRADERFSAAAIVERLRWQLEGWLSGSAPEAAPTAGITLLRLVADEVVRVEGRQLGLFGGRSDADERAIRGLDRLRGLLGPDAVFTCVAQGGRGPADRVVLVAWGEPVPTAVDDGPWPGRHPAPAPALVHPRPIAAELVDVGGAPVRVLATGRPSGTPAHLSIDGAAWAAVVAWSGPWLLDERNWDAAAHRRRVRCQLLTDDHHGYLACLEGGTWVIEATYD